MSSERKKLVKELDRVFSLYIRKRDNYKCVVCGLQKPQVVIQCGHLFSRKSMSTRWDELNAYAQCSGCNLIHNYDFERYRRVWIAKNDHKRYDKLYAKWSKPTKFTLSELEMLINFFKKKLKIIDGQDKV